MEQRSEEWFKARQGRVTGSAVGAILGVNPYTKSSDVMRRMVRDWHGAPSEFTGNVATNWGTVNEAGAVSEFEMRTGHTVEPCGFYTKEEWLGASPDGLVGTSGLLEVKCPFSLRDKTTPVFKTAKMQLHYYSQMQVQLYVTDRKICYFYQWAPNGDELEIVPYDETYMGTALKALRMFYDKYLKEREFPNAEKYLDGQKITIQTT